MPMTSEALLGSPADDALAAAALAALRIVDRKEGGNKDDGSSDDDDDERGAAISSTVTPLAAAAGSGLSGAVLLEATFHCSEAKERKRRRGGGESGLNRPFVLKTARADNAAVRDEFLFYRDVAPALLLSGFGADGHGPSGDEQQNLWRFGVPRCLGVDIAEPARSVSSPPSSAPSKLAEAGDDGKWNRVALERLPVGTGGGEYVLGDQVGGMSEGDATRVMLALAQLHGRYWQGRIRSDVPLARRFPWLRSARSRLEEFRELYRTSPPLGEREIRDVAPTVSDWGVALRTLRDGDARYGTLIDSLASQPSTLLHMDVRGENLFLASSPGNASAVQADCVLLDWQNVCFGPPALDLAYFMAGSLTVETRRAAEKNLLIAYHTELTRVVGASSLGYSAKELAEDYDRATTWPLVWARITFPRLESLVDAYVGPIDADSDDSDAWQIAKGRARRFLRSSTLRYTQSAIDAAARTRPKVADARPIALADGSPLHAAVLASALDRLGLLKEDSSEGSACACAMRILVIERILRSSSEIIRARLVARHDPGRVYGLAVIKRTVQSEFPRRPQAEWDRVIQSSLSEADFYENVAPQLLARTSLRVPRLLMLERGSVDGRPFAQVLSVEDLPGKDLPQPLYPSRQQSESALRWLAEFHATFYGDLQSISSFANRTGGFWLGDERTLLAADVARWRGFLQAVRAATDGAANLFWSDERLDELHETVMGRLESLTMQVTGVDDEYATLLHGDFRLANMLFSGDESADVGVVNFEWCGRGHPAADVAFFLASSVAEVDLADEDRILAQYLTTFNAALEKGGKPAIAAAAFRRRYDAALLHYASVVILQVVSAALPASMVDCSDTRDLCTHDRSEPHLRWLLGRTLALIE
jgi:aminoglycoside phosphotransferase (APT) family kinase protein